MKKLLMLAMLATSVAIAAQERPVFKDFTLARHDTRERVTLSKMRGSVVLVSFWFPTCGPCLREFPYLQRALDKFKSRGFEILTINIVPAEDMRVMPTLKARGVTFVPLRMPDDDFAAREYRVGGAPSNFLLDGDGRVAGKPLLHDEASAAAFEAQVDSLLKAIGR
jgi:thiol-disulfide isomerase/thioredoxin